MKSIARLTGLSLVWLLAFSGAASAGDLCLSDGPNGKYIFSKIKLPKKPGSTTSLQGMRIQAGLGGFPFDGVASMVADGTYNVTILVHSFTAGTNSLGMGWTAADATLAGSAVFDTDADSYKDDGILNLTAVDCSTVTVP